MNLLHWTIRIMKLERCPRCRHLEPETEMRLGGGYCNSCNDDMYQNWLADQFDPDSPAHVV